MKPAKKLLLEELTTTLAPHTGIAPGAKLPKGMAKTVQHLADQILRQRAKQEKQQKAAPAKIARQLLSEQLAGLLDAHLHDSPEQERQEPVVKAISKTAGQLAGKLTRLRKQVGAEAETPAEPRARRSRTAARPQA